MIEQLEKLDARIPKWDISDLTRRDCPFCRGENDTVLIRPDRLPVAFCSSCGCWYVAQLPSASDIKRLYDGYYDVHRPADLSGKGVSQMLADARRAGETDWQFQLLSRLLDGVLGKRILDVGCGCGRFLMTAKLAGADVVGCDLSPEACEFANHELGLTVHLSDLSSCVPILGQVDAVVMSDFIEHPIEPLSDILAALTVLKTGGFLLLHTPNGGEAGTTIARAKEWAGFRVDLEHFQYLSPRTVNWLAGRFGMCLEQLSTFGFPDLKGIEALPRRTCKGVDQVRNAVKRIPYLRTTVKILRTVKAELRGENRDTRLGSYHLFAVLRKR